MEKYDLVSTKNVMCFHLETNNYMPTLLHELSISLVELGVIDDSTQRSVLYNSYK